MSTMRFGSVCSGIEAASVAWNPIGWDASWFAEIDPFANAVLSHRYPGVTNHGDFTKIKASALGAIRLLVGGTPCQSFSVAGKRLGLDDPRGNLAIEFLRLARNLCPEWLVWENVPGVLSSNSGRDLGAFLGMLGELGYGWAYRVLDAQYIRVDGFGRAVPQRRRRVFVVGCLGDWRRAVAVLFERESLSGNPPPGRTAEEDFAPDASPCLGARSNSSHRTDSEAYVADTLTGHAGRMRADETYIPEVGFALNASCGRNEDGGRIGNAWNTNYVAHTLRADGFDASEDGTGRGILLVPVVASFNPQAGDKQTSLGFDPFSRTVGTLSVGQVPAIIGPRVRRLTPLECERLQGLPDGYTLVPYRKKPAKDGNRYKAIGNSIAIPPLRWIGMRIDMARAIKA